jgi:hypothetical protein
MDTVRDTEKDAYDVAVELIEVVNAKAAAMPDGQLWAISSLSIIIRNLAMVEPWLKDRLECELKAFSKLKG